MVAAARSAVALALRRGARRAIRRLPHDDRRRRSRRQRVQRREGVRAQRRSAPTCTWSRRARRTARAWSCVARRAPAVQRSAPLRTFDGERAGASSRYADARRCGAGRRRGRRRDAALARPAPRRRRRWRSPRWSAACTRCSRRRSPTSRSASSSARRSRVFQAVQHQIADMATAYTAARHLAWQAITRVAAGTRAGRRAASTRRPTSAQAFKRITLGGHHLHGGAGFVVEHPLHYHSERAQSLCIRYAPEAPALAAIAAALLD